jgi:hypothetical protein
MEGGIWPLRERPECWPAEGAEERCHGDGHKGGRGCPTWSRSASEMPFASGCASGRDDHMAPYLQAPNTRVKR